MRGQFIVTVNHEDLEHAPDYDETMTLDEIAERMENIFQEEYYFDILRQATSELKGAWWRAEKYKEGQ